MSSAYLSIGFRFLVLLSFGVCTNFVCNFQTESSFFVLLLSYILILYVIAVFSLFAPHGHTIPNRFYYRWDIFVRTFCDSSVLTFSSKIFVQMLAKITARDTLIAKPSFLTLPVTFIFETNICDCFFV